MVVLFTDQNFFLLLPNSGSYYESFLLQVTKYKWENTYIYRCKLALVTNLPRKCSKFD